MKVEMEAMAGSMGKEGKGEVRQRKEAMYTEMERSSQTAQRIAREEGRREREKERKGCGETGQTGETG